jgi:hypothetical protein
MCSTDKEAEIARRLCNSRNVQDAPIHLFVSNVSLNAGNILRLQQTRPITAGEYDAVKASKTQDLT